MYDQNDFNYPTSHPRRRKILWSFAIGFIVFIGFIAAHWANALLTKPTQDATADSSLWNKVINILPLSGDKPAFDADYALPTKDSNRLDILLMGMRGADDPNGGELTDTIMLLSYDQTTHKASLVSIPRDLYVTIEPGLQDKINSAYVRLGLTGVKTLFSRITGITIDHVVVFDFTAFQDIVDQFGGVDVTLDKPFSETQQWGYTFSLPAGQNHLNGEQALYFVRSRFTTNDFDRAARQQKLILALKQKVQATNWLADPLQALTLYNTLRSHIRTDINVLQLKQLIDLAQNLNGTTIKHDVISTDNLLYDTKLDGSYILLPKGGTLASIKAFFQNVLK